MNKFLLNEVNAINGKGLYLPLFNFKLGSYFTFFLRKTKGSILSLPNALLFAMLVVFTYNVGAQCTPPSPPTASGTTVNCGDAATFTANGSTGNYVWFDDANGTNSIGTGNSLTINNLSADSTIYVAASTGSGGSTTIYSENWQSGNGGWTLGNSGPYWNRISGTTGSFSTGPNGGSNNGNPTNGNFYIYLETSTSAGTAYLTGPGFTINGDATFQFRYHMYGSSMGTLGVQVFNGSTWNTVWSLSGQQQTSGTAQWTAVSIPLTGYSGNINVRFSGLRGSSFRSDMAVDDVTITESQPGCFSTLVPVTATVNGLTAPTANGTTVNCGDAATLTASGAPSGGGYVWFDDAAGTNQVGTGSSFTTPALTANATYYVASSSGSANNIFYINTLSTAGSFVTDHNSFSGDDRGGIAVTEQYYYYVGDNNTVRYNMPGLTNPVSYARRDGIFSDLSGSGTLYTLWNGSSDPVGTSTSFAVNAVRTLNADCSFGATTISLSQSFTMGNTNTSAIFSGAGYVILYTGTGGSPANTYFKVDLPSGTVTNLGVYTLTASFAENWARWGVAEYDGTDYRVVYVGASTQIRRLNLSNGAVSTVQSFSSLSDMACITYAPWYDRWYFHHEGSSQFGGSSETAGYANGTHTYNSSSLCQSTLVPVTVNVNSASTPTVTSASVSCGQTATLTASSNAPITWYSDASGATQVGTGASFTTPALTANTTYYVMAGSGACASSLVPVTASVNGPTPPTASGTTVNCGDAATFTANGSTGNYVWFDDANGTNSIGTGNSLTINNLSADSTIYVAASSGSGGSTTIYSENWQSGNGGWTLGNSGPYWNRISGGTSSSLTGPNGGSNNGTPTNGNFYVYLETSNGAGTAYLTGPGFTINGNATLEFSYHMYGATMGTLGVEIFDGSNWTQVWSLSGQQQSSSAQAWTDVSIPLTGYSGAINIRFSGLKGSSYTGDMAVDDVTITESQPVCFSSLVPVTATVNGLTAPTASGTTVNCGDAATLTASGAPSGGGYIWYTDASGVNQVGTGSNYTTPILSSTTTYYVAATSGSTGSGSVNFNYTGGVQNWTVPAGVTQIDISAWGAEGGGSALSGNGSSGLGGKGGYSSGTFNVTPGEVLSIYVGGHGLSSTSGPAAGGFNGGGSGYASGSGEPGNGGGGASDVRQGGNALSNRRIVAGGGGGGGEDSGDAYGHGGGLTGVGYSTTYDASQTAPGLNGALGQGATTINGDGGGGGGGYYGGGTFQSSSIGADTQGGGGGSGYIGGVSGGQTIAGNSTMPNPSGGTMVGRSGHGLVQINYSSTGCTSGLVPVTAVVDPIASPSITGNTTICENQSTALTASGAPLGGDYAWYSDPAGNNQIGTGPNYSTGNLSNSTTFYVQISDGNGSGNTGSLNTTFAAGNGSNGNMFNINLLDDITITDFDVHQYAGQTGNFEVYYKSGTYNGFETNAAAWTLIGTANNIASNGQGNPTPLGLNLNLQLQSGAHAFYITSTNTNVYYTNGTNNNNIYAQNSEIEFFEGVGKAYPFGLTFSPRIWNGIIHYETGSGQSACLSAIEPITVTVDQPATPPTISGGGTFCFGEQVTLTATGGSVPASQCSWFENTVTSASIGTGGSTTVTPNGTTDYIVQVPANGACAAANSNTITVTVPTPDNTLSVNNSQSTCMVNQNGYVHFLDPNGKLIASINSNGQNLGNVTATSYVEAAPLQVQDCASSILTSVLDRHWVITPQFQPTGPVEVVLPMGQNEEQSLVTNANSNSNPDDDIIGLSDIVLTKYAGPSNVDNNFQNNCFSQGGNGTLDLFTQGMSGFVYDYWPSYTGNDLYASYDINSFSEFWLHGSSNLSPLPVSLTAFNASCENDDFIEVTWETASEMNASHFIVERSRDGVSWSNEHEVDAAGNANTLNSYSFEDHNAGIGFEGYYRLRQVDFDGEQTLYGPISVQCDEIKNASMEVFPNPTNGNFTLRIHSDRSIDNTEVTIFNAQGKVVHQQLNTITNGSTTLFFKRNDLEVGLYFVHINAPSIKIAPQKIIIH